MRERKRIVEVGGFEPVCFGECGKGDAERQPRKSDIRYILID